MYVVLLVIEEFSSSGKYLLGISKRSSRYSVSVIWYTVPNLLNVISIVITSLGMLSEFVAC